MSAGTYHGRFAPTPSGPLHWGSLLTALVSYLDARAQQGFWTLRIDDLDGPRVRAGAADAIQRNLEAHGLCWDGTTTFQSAKLEQYQLATETLLEQGSLYYCTCPRRIVAGRPYPGTCREKRNPAANASLRVRCSAEPVAFNDRFAGPQTLNLADADGDFIVRRRDGLIAYQLAAAIDDAQPTITQVVRGGDLLESTHRQLYLMKLLKLRPPGYGHLPILVDRDGVKLSKQIGSAPIHASHAANNLHRLLRWLGLAIAPATTTVPPVEEQLQAAIASWSQWLASTPPVLRLASAPLRAVLGNH